MDPKHYDTTRPDDQYYPSDLSVIVDKNIKRNLAISHLISPLLSLSIIRYHPDDGILLPSQVDSKSMLYYPNDTLEEYGTDLLNGACYCSKCRQIRKAIRKPKPHELVAIPISALEIMRTVLDSIESRHSSPLTRLEPSMIPQPMLPTQGLDIHDGFDADPDPALSPTDLAALSIEDDRDSPLEMHERIVHPNNRPIPLNITLPKNLQVTPLSTSPVPTQWHQDSKFLPIPTPRAVLKEPMYTSTPRPKSAETITSNSLLKPQAVRKTINKTIKVDTGMISDVFLSDASKPKIITSRAIVGQKSNALINIPSTQQVSGAIKKKDKKPTAKRSSSVDKYETKTLFLAHTNPTPPPKRK